MSKEQVEAGGGGMLGRRGWDGVRAGYEGSELHGDFRVGVGPDGMSEDLGYSKDLGSRVWGIQVWWQQSEGASWDPEIGWGRAGRGGWAR